MEQTTAALSRAAVVRKDRSHRRIEDAAARLLRRDGMRGASVRKVMAEAGLTIGGFYAHFSSKDGLLEAAFSRALAEKRRSLRETIGTVRGDRYVDRFLRAYLTRDHRDDRETGCPFAALLSEVPRSTRAVRSRVREEFARGLGRFIDRLGEGSRPEARRRAILVLCLAFGALAMSRALAGYPESEELLGVAASASRYFTRRRSR